MEKVPATDASADFKLQPARGATYRRLEHSPGRVAEGAAGEVDRSPRER